MSSKLTWIFIVLLCVTSLSWTIYRSILVEKQFPGDLRNRIVGARLQKDGRLPYFYKWRPGDSTRYYDTDNFDSLKVSNITATPVFHVMMYPLADLPGRRISYIWLVLEYLFFLICIITGFSFAKNNLQKWSVLLAGILFLLTEAWIMHIANGQMYILIPMLCLLFYYFIFHNRRTGYAFLAGCCAILLVLIRPNAIVFFLPFLLVIKNFSTRFLLFFAVPVIVLFGLVLGSKNERALWIDYKDQVGEQIKLHQGLNPTLQQNYPTPNYAEFDGWSVKQIQEDYEKYPYYPYSENGNVFVLARDLLHVKVPVWLLSVLSLSTVVIVFFFFWAYKVKSGSYSLTSLAIIGFCLYMITDLFSPIFRGQYYTVQWLFPVLIAAAHLQKRDKWLASLIFIALLLNVVNTSLLKMEHTIGEYIMLLAFIGLSLRRETETSQ